MSKPVEGVSRWQQRKAAKAHMYATSTEQEGRGVAARRQLATDSKYVPRTGQNWKGSAWGLASTQVSGRQNEKHTRFSSGARRGELWYGEKRQLNTDLPPDDAPNFLARGSAALVRGMPAAVLVGRKALLSSKCIQQDMAQNSINNVHARTHCQRRQKK